MLTISMLIVKERHVIVKDKACLEKDDADKIVGQKRVIADVALDVFVFQCLFIRCGACEVEVIFY